MKRSYIWGYALIFMFFQAAPAWATNPGNKLARGIINIPTSLIEIPHAYSRSKEGLSDFSRKHPEEFLTPTVNTPYQYLVKAPLTGIAKMVCRLLAGCYDIVTFPFSMPRYYAPLYEPEFVFDTMPYAFKICEQGRAYMSRGRYRAAAARFSQAIKVDPANGQAFYQRGRAYGLIDRYRESVDDLNAADLLGYHPELEHIASPDDD